MNLSKLPQFKSANFNSMSWPVPSERIEHIEWMLRHNPKGLTQDDLLHIAFVMSAYVALIFKTQKERNLICKKILASK